MTITHPTIAQPISSGANSGVIAYRAMAHASPLPMAMTTGPKHTLCYLNPAFCQLLGIESAGPFGQSLSDVLVISDVHQLLLDNVYLTGTAAHAVDLELNHKKPEYGYSTSTIWSIQDEQGTPTGLVLLVNDSAHNEQLIVDTQAANEQLLLAGLREQDLAERLLHQFMFTNAITCSLSEGVYALDLAGRFTFVNPAAEELLGWREEELIGRNAYTAIHMKPTSGGVQEDEALLSMMRSGIPYHTDDVILIRQNGTMFPASYSVAPIITAGKITGAVIALRDMTEVQRLQRVQEEYLELTSHDLRTPLTAIMGHTQLLLRTLAQQGLEREMNSARIVLESSRRIDLMLETLADHRHLEIAQKDIPRKAVDLVQLVIQVIDQAIPPVDRDRVQLEGVAQLSLILNAAWIERVLVNLLVNALKFSAPRTPIAIHVFQENKRALVSITDKGDGINPQDIPHLFEKHYRLHQEAEGTGLGLYISKLIMEEHGGQLWVESEVGKGSCFTLAIPIE